MKIPPREEELLKKAYSQLFDACHNIYCLGRFLKRENPDTSSIEYTVLLNGLLRMREIESLMQISLNYPVFGKEIQMGDRNKLYQMLREILGCSVVGYLNFDGSQVDGTCINESLHLYEISVED